MCDGKQSYRTIIKTEMCHRCGGSGSGGSRPGPCPVCMGSGVITWKRKGGLQAMMEDSIR